MNIHNFNKHASDYDHTKWVLPRANVCTLLDSTTAKVSNYDPDYNRFRSMMENSDAMPKMPC